MLHAATVTPSDSLDRVLAGSLLDALAAAAELDLSAAGADVVLEAFHSGDALARLLLLPALARAGGDHAEAAVLAALEGPDAGEREHAAWALGRVPPLAAARPALAALQQAGGFAGMLAELALGPRAALGAGPGAPPRSGRLRIVQVVMQGWVDAGLTRVGAGDGGGLATLMVHLSAALAAHPGVDEVITLARGGGEGAEREPVAPGARIERIAVGGTDRTAPPDMWLRRRALEAGLERALRRIGPVDAVHLRFADAGTFAALRVCRRLGLPVFFTLAPDPHGLIDSRERAGGLDRPGLVRADRTEHLLFRARLVEHLRDSARGLALLPRAGGREELEALLGLPADDGGRLVRTVPEGIPLGAVAAASRRFQDHRDAGPLPDLVAAIPPHRRGRPLIVSAGRMHRVKGFDRLVEAWAGSSDLRDGFNLVVVGGDLAHPSGEERAVLDAIGAAMARHPRARDGLVLLGHRGHGEVLALMAAARHGISAAVAPDGVYACASEKEEFGLALLEATGSGLSVLGPDAGGPPTYIEDGLTGTLADTSSVDGLRDGLRRAAAARHDRTRAALAAGVVRERFSIGAMADGLVRLYAAGRAL